MGFKVPFLIFFCVKFSLMISLIFALFFSPVPSTDLVLKPKQLSTKIWHATHTAQHSQNRLR